MRPEKGSSQTSSSLLEGISRWIGLQVNSAGAKGGVVGMSGGLDSSVTALLCKQALGDELLGLILPCHSDPLDEHHARMVADRFDIRVEKIDLGPVFEVLLSILPAGGEVTVANLKPRLRMMTLYYYSNRLDYLVVGSGNKSELQTGYFTKYGDGGVDILPLGGLSKTDVRALAQELGVPEEIMAKPPSAGLWSGQTDEGELGITYEELDRALQMLESDHKSDPEDVLLSRVRELIAHSEHKRAPVPMYEP